MKRLIDDVPKIVGWTIGLAASVVVGGVLAFVDDRGPEWLQLAIGWVPGRVSTFILRDVMHDSGTHGLGYYNPLLDLVLYRAFIVVLAILSGLVCRALVTALYDRQ